MKALPDPPIKMHHDLLRISERVARRVTGLRGYLWSNPGPLPLSATEMKLHGPVVRALALAKAVYTSQTIRSETLDLTDPQGQPRVIACSRLHSAQQVPLAALRTCIDPSAEARLYHGHWGFRMNGLRVEWRPGERTLSVGDRSVHTSRRTVRCAAAPRQIGGEWLLPVELIPLLIRGAPRR